MTTKVQAALLGGILALGAVAATSAKSAPITYDIQFTASNFSVVAGSGPPPVTPVVGSFTLEFDPTLAYDSVDIVSGDININVGGPVVFSYSSTAFGGQLNVHVGNAPVNQGTDDFSLIVRNFLTDPTFFTFFYSQQSRGVYSSGANIVGTVDPPGGAPPIGIPTPAALPLFAASLAILAAVQTGGHLIARRRRRASAAVA